MSEKYFLTESDFTDERIHAVSDGISRELYEPTLLNSKNLAKQYRDEMDRPDRPKKLPVVGDLLHPFFRKPTLIERISKQKRKYAIEFVRHYILSEIMFTFFLDLLDNGIEAPTESGTIVAKVATISLKIIDHDISYKNKRTALTQAGIYGVYTK